MINSEKDQLCGWNGCCFYATHKGTCRDEWGGFLNGPRATAETCPCSNCSPQPSDSAIQILWSQLCRLIRPDNRVPALEPEYAVALQEAIDSYLKKINQASDEELKHETLEPLSNFIFRIRDEELNDGEIVIELTNRERIIREQFNK